MNWDYQPEDYDKPKIEEGDYTVIIHDVAEGHAKSSGAQMITVQLVVKGVDIIFKHYLVQGEYFNANMTKFFDCFKIPRGNFEFQRWRGRPGKAHIGKGKPNAEGKSYFEVNYLIVDKPAMVAQPQQPAGYVPAGTATFVDDIPGQDPVF